jgi:hypothetical protein
MVLFRKSKRAGPFTIEPEITPAREGLASENDHSSLVLWSRLANYATARKVIGPILGQLQRKLRSVVSQLLTRTELIVLQRFAQYRMSSTQIRRVVTRALSQGSETKVLILSTNWAQVCTYVAHILRFWPSSSKAKISLVDFLQF